MDHRHPAGTAGPDPGARSGVVPVEISLHIVGVLFPEENVERREPARDRSRWPICSVATPLH
jgi:hypothetical protein